MLHRLCNPSFSAASLIATEQPALSEALVFLSSPKKSDPLEKCVQKRSLPATCPSPIHNPAATQKLSTCRVNQQQQSRTTITSETEKEE